MYNKQPRHTWTELEIAYLIDNYHNKDTREIATHLKLTPRQVSSYAGKLLLRKVGRQSRNGDNRKKREHDENTQFKVREKYTASQIAIALQVSEAKIEHWIHNDWIKTIRKPHSSPNSNNPHRVVTNKALALFILRYPYEIAYDNMSYDTLHWILDVIGSVVKTVPVEKNQNE